MRGPAGDGWRLYRWMSQGLLLTLAVTMACIQGTPSLEDRQSNAVSRNVSQTAPEPSHRLEVVFGTYVELLGYDVAPANPQPGDSFRLTWYWHCTRELGPGWQIFTHLVDRATGQMVPSGNYDSASVNGFRNSYPPPRWKAGEYITDVQRITLPEDLTYEEVEFRTGLYSGRNRLEIRRGPADRLNRARGPAFATGFSPPEPPRVVVPRVTKALTIDGRLTEEAWSKAVTTPPFGSAQKGAPSEPRTKARLLYDEEALYVAFECDDDNLHSTFTKRDDQLWTQDAVEVFIDPRRTGRDYYEFQVSPAGVLFDTQVGQHPRRDDSFDGQAQAQVELRGTLNNRDDRDQGWTVELKIPFEGMSQSAPTEGQEWRINLFRLDNNARNVRAFLAWSPPLANTTHVPARFSHVTFGPAITATQAPASQTATTRPAEKAAR